MIFFNWFSSIRLKWWGKKVRKPSPSVGFDKAQQIGVLVGFKQNFNPEALLYFIEKLRNQGKKVTILQYQDQKQATWLIPGAQVFSRKELSWLGSIQSPSAHEFIQIPFDYLYILSDKPMKPLLLIAAKSKAKTLIGRASSDFNPYLDLMIQLPEHASQDVALQHLYHYSSRITA
jgi:hypothetical protein